MKKSITVVALAGLALVGCEEKKPAAGAPKSVLDSTKDAAKGAVDGAKAKLAELRDKAAEAIKPQVEAAKAKVDELAKKAESLDAAKKAVAGPLVEAAKKAYSDVAEKFEALKGAGEGWEKAKEGAEAALKAFGEAAAKAAEALK